MTTDKPAIQNLAAICAKNNVTTVVISPGSRNAPLIIAFNRQPGITCLSIIDERSAAFFALGIAQQTNKPVALISTSGTATLNYAPAIAEAYYQEIPLLILTADRPAEWIDKGESQVIRQKNIYNNYINASFELLPCNDKSDILDKNNNIIYKAIKSTLEKKKGPVHINIPLEEPLYNLSKHLENKVSLDIIEKEKSEISFPESTRWNSFSKKMILTGMLNPGKEINFLLNKISENEDTIVLTETNSNLFGDKFFSSIDKVVNSIDEKESEMFRPELLITFGNKVISKMIKAFLRKYKPKEHWHIDIAGKNIDTYNCLSSTIPVTPKDFLSQLESPIKIESDYFNIWDSKRKEAEVKHQQYISKVPYSDIKVFDTILNNLPNDSVLQMGNSTVVRYIQLFDQNKTINYFSNRGTSGIDGCTSTAAGAAYANKDKLVTLISGDISFLYDSNALWNNNLTNNFKIIIINNSGGNIFRFLNGSSDVEELEEFFETSHNVDIKKIAEAYSISYDFCDELNMLRNCLDNLYESKKVSILEIKTPSVESAESLKKYFNFIK